MFNVVSHAFPYNAVLQQCGIDPETPQSRPAFIQDFMSKKVQIGEPLCIQQQHPVDDMWDGLDRFSKAQELQGRIVNELKRHSLLTDEQLVVVNELIEARVTDVIFIQEIQRVKDLAIKHTDDKISALDA